MRENVCIFWFSQPQDLSSGCNSDPRHYVAAQARKGSVARFLEPTQFLRKVFLMDWLPGTCEWAVDLPSLLLTVS